ncbi:CAP domain-containing protein [Haloferula sp.]|uniref:CAP domain-containing protein n=1 Tax=Haloferula sp. TaxID=2497595 RepID=UPI0032A01EA6
MKSTSLIYGFIAGVTVLLASCASNLDTTRVPMSTAAVSNQSSVVGKLDHSLNQYRRSIGKASIQRHAALDRLAQQHCMFMAKNRGKFTLGSANISHYGFEERSLLAQRQYGMTSMAENVAGGVIKGDIANQLTGAWTGSKKHLYNLKQNWDVTGIGVYVADDGMVYATQLFANKNNSHMEMVDRFRQF